MFTAVYYAGWYTKFYTPERLGIALAGALIFPVLFTFSALVRGARRRSEILPVDLALTAAAVAAAVGQAWVLLAPAHETPLAFTLIGVTVFGLGVLRVMRARRMSTAAAEETMLLVSAVPLALLVPALLKAEGAVIGWAFAAAAFATVGGSARRLALFALAGACLLASWVAGSDAGVEHSGYFRVIANPVFLAWCALVAACFYTGARFRAALGPRQGGLGMLGAGVQVFAVAAFLGLLSYEAVAWFNGQKSTLHFLDSDGRNALSDYQTAVLAILWALYPWIYLWGARARPWLWRAAAVHYAVLGVGFLWLLACLHAQPAMYFLNFSLAACALFPAMVFVTARRFAPGNPAAARGLELYGHALALALLTTEIVGNPILREWAPKHYYWIKMALVSVGWALWGVGMVGWGIKRSRISWRWFGLILLGVTVIKVFTVDLVEARDLWRVLSFAALGGLLLVCSYAYIRREARRRSECEGN